MRTRQNSRLVAAALTVAAGALVGCNAPATTNHAGDVGALRADPSPALMTLSERGTDRENRYTSYFDSNRRMINDDWDRLWMSDRPSHLTKYPTIR
ncbi:MAG: hypothetical protein AAGA55_06170 [Planctomycetota bacterium]